MTPLHAVYVIVKTIASLAINLEKAFLGNLESAKINFKMVGFISAVIYLSSNIFNNLIAHLADTIGKIATIPLFATGLFFVSLYGIIRPSMGRHQLTYLTWIWEENALLHLLGLQPAVGIKR